MDELLFILTTSAGTVTLANAPDGWDESLIQWERSDKYWGVFRSFTIPLKFVKVGATLIRTEFYLHGTKGISNIVIQRLNKISLVYVNAYVGILDFGTFKDSDYYVEVNLLDSGLAKSLKDNGSTEYETTARKFGISNPDFIQFAVGTTSIDDPKFGGIDIVDLIKKILDKMTNGAVTAGTVALKSTILDAYKAGTDHTINPVIVCRGRTFREPGMSPQGNFKLTFDDLFKSLQTWLGIGVGVEVIAGVDTLVIEHKSYFFDYDDIRMELGSVRNLSVYPNPKMMFNRIAIGFPAKEYNDFSMTNEPNATSKWQGPNKTNSTELDLVSKFRADKWGITQIITSQTDSDDDDIFFVELNWTTNYSGRWEFNEFSKARQTGITTEWYVGNAVMTPRRCLLANQTWLESCMYGHTSDLLKYTSGDNDLYNIEVDRYTKAHGLQGQWMVERGDITIYAGSLFLPINIDFEAAFPDDMIKTLNDYNNSLVSFEYKGYTYTGYIMSVKAKLSGRGSQKITLLSSADNDLTTLIR